MNFPHHATGHILHEWMEIEKFFSVNFYPNSKIIISNDVPLRIYHQKQVDGTYSYCYSYIVLFKMFSQCFFAHKKITIRM